MRNDRAMGQSAPNFRNQTIAGVIPQGRFGSKIDRPIHDRQPRHQALFSSRPRRTQTRDTSGTAAETNVIRILQKNDAMARSGAARETPVGLAPDLAQHEIRRQETTGELRINEAMVQTRSFLRRPIARPNAARAPRMPRAPLEESTPPAPGLCAHEKPAFPSAVQLPLLHCASP